MCMFDMLDNVNTLFETGTHVTYLDCISFSIGNAKDYITAGLIDGGVFLTVNLGSGQFEVNIRPADARFDDNRWHQLVIRRDAKEVSLHGEKMRCGPLSFLMCACLYVRACVEHQLPTISKQ